MAGGSIKCLFQLSWPSFSLRGRGIKGAAGKDKTNGELLFQCTVAVAAAVAAAVTS